MTSPAYLSPVASRRRYEAVAHRVDYPIAALQELAWRLSRAAEQLTGDARMALRDRARELWQIVDHREMLAKQAARGDEIDRLECAREDAEDARRELEWMDSR